MYRKLGVELENLLFKLFHHTVIGPRVVWAPSHRMVQLTLLLPLAAALLLPSSGTPSSQSTARASRLAAVVSATPRTSIQAVVKQAAAAAAIPAEGTAAAAATAATAAAKQHAIGSRGLVLPELPKSKIRRGDYVVHRQYGIGNFEGVFRTTEFQTLANGTRVYQKALKVRFKDGTLEIAPRDAADDLKLFKRFEEVGEYGTVRLDGLRSRKSWEKRKERAAKKVWAVAADLVKMYAERQELRRTPCPPDDARMAQFASRFTFQPTPDQQRTFDEIAYDMISAPQPMDRLVCGDVGFGKTEVAMRAIYRAVCAGRQVGLLAPTTVLAAQHLRVLRERMPDVRIELLSSLAKRTPAELQGIRDDIAAGKVEVVVGTHALLSPKIIFKNLGLLVVDEEQRFGVRQKDKVKTVATSVDVLSLSATPIPRTMYMCMAGIRAMSTLNTPPAGRRPVQTLVRERNDGLVENAIREELARGGQVFYVVPRIEMVEAEVAFLSETLPETRIAYAYSGIADLEAKIVGFTLGEIDVLVATTIMENGIDIPNVNTIIVQNTQLFGLAQLHQLRGRVGRAAVQAYAYLLHPRIETISAEAKQRLMVLQRETDLGSGASLAQSDLQMRGAGNLFGEAQKGAGGLADIGLDLYVEVLQKAMRFLERKRALGLPDDEEVDAELLQASVDEVLLMGLDDSLATN